MTLNIVIKAAGKGSRMKSALPKVLQPLAGRSLLQHVVDMVAQLGADRVVVVTGYEAARVEAAVTGNDLRFVRQEPQLGTGHAAQQAVPALLSGGTTLILNGDVPLFEAETARKLIAACQGERLALLTVDLDDPSHYGRIVRQGEQVRRIVEHKDATPAEREIHEIYTGMMAAPTEALKGWLSRLSNHNAQGEYYLTEVVSLAVADGVPVVASQPRFETEVLGVNNARELADLERRVQRAQAEALLELGVRLADPARFDQRGTLVCGSDVDIDVNCIFEGKVTLGDGVHVGANCIIRDATIGDGVELKPFTHIDGASIGAHAQVGPFARLRPGASLGDEVHIGNFVEVKNATLARGAKANHLAYLGDASVGERVNFGAGSITANYDGANKHRTVIGNDVHVGSNCVIIAPVTLGDGATIGGGSTLSADAPAGQLTLARARQVSIAGWTRPTKKKA